ncbi:MAG: dTDP-glucose 4,6-dehydratase [Bdellovibrionota bacterium]
MSSSSSKVLLVTGGCGFIGSGFVKRQIEQGHHVLVLDALTYAGHRENLDGLDGGPGKLELIVGDICNGPLVRELLESRGVQAVINFAAESHVDRSIDAPAAFIETNIRGTFNLLSTANAYYQSLPDARKRTFRYVQISTDEVYGSLGPTGKFSETTPFAPNSPYSASKAAGDHLARAWFHTYGLPTITTNCSNNYGPRQFPEKLIPHMINCALSGKPLPVYGDGGNIRDWIHVEDHCHGIELALGKGRPGETYCFGGNAERNNLDVVRMICRHLDRLRPRADGKSYETGIAFVTDRLGHDRRYAIDDGLAQRELGFTRRYEFESGLAHTVEWYLKNTAWSQAVLGAKK